MNSIENNTVEEALGVAKAMEKMPGGRDMLTASVICLGNEVLRLRKHSYTTQSCHPTNTDTTKPPAGTNAGQ